MCFVEMNESEPSMKCRNGNLILSKPNSECKFGISLDVNWHNRQGGSRHKGGMTTKQALIRNMRTCRFDVKGDAEVETP